MLHKVVSLTDAFTFLANTTLNLFSIPDCRRFVTFDAIPKYGNYTTLRKPFRQFALTSSYCKRTEYAVLKHLRSSMNTPGRRFLFSCKSHAFTLDVAAYLIHHIHKSLGASKKAVRSRLCKIIHLYLILPHGPSYLANWNHSAIMGCYKNGYLITLPSEHSAHVLKIKHHGATLTPPLLSTTIFLGYQPLLLSFV